MTSITYPVSVLSEQIPHGSKKAAHRTDRRPGFIHNRLRLFTRFRNTLHRAMQTVHVLLQRIGIRSLRISDADGLEGYAVLKLNDTVLSDPSRS